MGRDRGGKPSDHRGQKPPAPRPRDGRSMFSDCGVVAVFMLVGGLGLFTGAGVIAALVIFS